MSFTLKVHFEFLCAFVPDQPFDPAGPAPQSAVVLLRDLSALPEPQVAADLAPHFARLQFFGGHGPGESFDEQDPEDSAVRIVHLDQEEITFRPDGQDPANNSLSVNLKPTAGDNRSFLWLAHMGEVAPGNQVINSSLLTDPEPGDPPHHPPIAARVKLSVGDLSAGRRTLELIRLSSGIEGERRIALTALLEIPFEQSVDVRLTKFGNGAFRTLSLRPDEDDAEDPESVNVYIRNSERDFLFGDVRGDGPYGGPDRDFVHYYDLAEGFSAGDPIPVPVGPDFAGSHGTCSPVKFNPGGGG